jgi:Icc-related predicted phosphoesterase
MSTNKGPWSVLIMSDIHCKWRDFSPEEINPGPVDGIIIAGDITNYGGDEFYSMYGWLAEWREYLTEQGSGERPIYYIGGNHDIGLKEFSSHFKDLATYIERSPVVTPWGGRTIVGANMSPCYDVPQLAKRWTNMTSSPEEENWYFDTLPPADIVVSHCPPATCLDLSHSKSLGSMGLYRYIDDWVPDVVICGHIHECGSQSKSAISKPFQGTTVYNTACNARVIQLND